MVKPFLVLLKPRVIWLLVLASVAGYVYAAPVVDWVSLLALVVVGVLSSGGAAAFNHVFERDIDALMSRTAARPLPRGLVSVGIAFAYASAVSALGVLLSLAWLGPLPTLFVVLGWFSYVVVYTVWLKRRSWLNVLAGGFAGNASFLTGYVFGRGTLDWPGVLMSFAVYLWIPAHIWSLAYRYREDYRRAGVPMFSTVVDQRTAVVAISLLNIASALYMAFLYVLFGGGPLGYVFVAPAVGLTLYTSALALVKKSDDAFWKMFKASSPALALFLIALMLH